MALSLEWDARVPSTSNPVYGELFPGWAEVVASRAMMNVLAVGAANLS